MCHLQTTLDTRLEVAPPDLALAFAITAPGESLLFYCTAQHPSGDEESEQHEAGDDDREVAAEPVEPPAGVLLGRDDAMFVVVRELGDDALRRLAALAK